MRERLHGWIHLSLEQRQANRWCLELPTPRQHTPTRFAKQVHPSRESCNLTWPPSLTPAFNRSPSLTIHKHRQRHLRLPPSLGGPAAVTLQEEGRFRAISNKRQVHTVDTAAHLHEPVQSLQ